MKNVLGFFSLYSLVFVCCAASHNNDASVIYDMGVRIPYVGAKIQCTFIIIRVGGLRFAQYLCYLLYLHYISEMDVC